MNGFMTPDNSYNLFLPRIEKVISDLKLPFTLKDNFRLIEGMTETDVTVSDSTLNKIMRGEVVGKNANKKLDKLFANFSTLYQVSPALLAIIKRSLSVRSNATDWLYYLDGFNQDRQVANWANTTGFFNKRCIQDIEFFEELKNTSADSARLKIYFVLLREHSLIPVNLIEAFYSTVQHYSHRDNKALVLSDTIDMLLFNFHLRVDFLFSAAAHFERDLDIPHFDMNPSYDPQCRVGKTIGYYIDENKPETNGYRNLFGCFLRWLIEHMPKSDGTPLTWSELASCIPMPENNNSAETLEKRKYDELRKWRKATTNRHKPGNKKLSEFVARLFGLGDDNNGQADIVYFMLKFFILLDEIILKWEAQIVQLRAETGFHAEIDRSVLIDSVLRHYNEHWRLSALNNHSGGQLRLSTAIQEF